MARETDLTVYLFENIVMRGEKWKNARRPKMKWNSQIREFLSKRKFNFRLTDASVFACWRLFSDRFLINFALNSDENRVHAAAMQSVIVGRMKQKFANINLSIFHFLFVGRYSQANKKTRQIKALIHSREKLATDKP